MLQKSRMQWRLRKRFLTETKESKTRLMQSMPLQKRWRRQRFRKQRKRRGWACLLWQSEQRQSQRQWYVLEVQRWLLWQS